MVCYVTTDRRNMEAQIAGDVVPLFAEHLDLIDGPGKITLFLYSRGGDAMASWTIANLIRQFCDSYEVVVPLSAHSGATVVALGASNIGLDLGSDPGYTV